MKVTNKIRAKVCRMANNLVKEGYGKAVGDGSQPLHLSEPG